MAGILFNQRYFQAAIGPGIAFFLDNEMACCSYRHVHGTDNNIFEFGFARNRIMPAAYFLFGKQLFMAGVLRSA